MIHKLRTVATPPKPCTGKSNAYRCPLVICTEKTGIFPQDCLQEPALHIFCLLRCPPQRAPKDTSFMLAARMLVIETVVAKLSHIHNCPLGIWKFHTNRSSRTISLPSVSNVWLFVNSSTPVLGAIEGTVLRFAER